MAIKNYITPVLKENQVEKKMENEMETRIVGKTRNPLYTATRILSTLSLNPKP